MTAAYADAGDPRSQPLPTPVGQDLVRLSGDVLELSRFRLLPSNPQAASEPLTITVVLNRSDQAGFEAFLAGLSDPSSPDYRHPLSQQELTARFGPSQQAYDAVRGYVESYGFALAEGSANRLTLTFQGTRAQAEAAFHVTIDDYADGARIFYANADDPAVPASIAPYILGIVGLNNLAVPRRG